jgi:ubiquinone/menaquinone biosynthesis C-methylase UbiE
MSDYSAIYLYASTIGAPMPLDRASRREKQARRPNSTPDGSLAARRHSRSSSSDQASMSSRSSHYTARQLSLSGSYSQGPAASAAVGPQHQQGSASASAAATSSSTTPTASTATSSPNLTSSISNNSSTSSGSFSKHHSDQHHPPPLAPLASSAQLPPQPPTPGRAARTLSRLHRARLSGSLLDAGAARNAQDLDPAKFVRQMTGFPASRAESVSSASGQTSASSRTILSTDASASLVAARPFVQRNGRTFLNDETLPYPLPSDLTELHRQALRTMLLIQVIGAPVLSPGLIKKPPQRVLEIGCGSGFWSTMCHQYFKSRGHGGLSFTGIDIAPLGPDNSSSASDDAMKPSGDMQWKFIQHDLRHMPWPIPSEEYDLVMVKDVSYAVTNKMMPTFIEECVRMVKPGGTFEMWDSDHLIRSLRPHVPTSTVSAEDAEQQAAAASLGAYVINPQTPLTAPSNDYINEYNSWLSKALESLDIHPLPCTIIGPTLIQEYETLGDVRSRRIALPLSEFRWEKEGIGGVITTDTKTDSKGREPPPTPRADKKTLTAGQIALRQTALLTQVQEIQALEPILREVSGKSQDEWDMWLGKMMSDLMDDNRTSLSECLEFGAWYAKKKKVTG